ncbi:MAG: hypothetical protein EZS28_026178 [Streblomastix strix]|uniref:Uncharacterized protein n=1 Tax=Streblomastix strix TaxID=222440 RepID=A0A5J4V7V5_9EUKA|nr:MAG: hypothetical protein EZS28_026178 [Streblomastix strix]
MVIAVYRLPPAGKACPELQNSSKEMKLIMLILLIKQTAQLKPQVKVNNASCQDVKQFLKTYQGFDFAAHEQQVPKFFRTNFCIYAYRQNEDGDLYFLDYVIKPKEVDSETVNEKLDEDVKDVVKYEEEAKDFNIQMLHFEIWPHILYFSDPVALTGKQNL